MWIIIYTNCFPNCWKVTWQYGGGPNHYFFQEHKKAQAWARKMNGGKYA